MKHKIYSNLFLRLKGLMFSKRLKNKVIILKFKKEQLIRLHMFFVFFHITALWVNKGNKITYIEHLSPFTISKKKKALYIVEMPLTKKYRMGMKFKLK